MQKLLKTMLVLFAVCGSISAQNILSLNVSTTSYKGHSLAYELDLHRDRIYDIDSLIVSGTISTSDYSRMSKLCQLGKLKGIDLSHCYTENNIIPSYAFNPDMVNSDDGRYKSHLEYISLPCNIEVIGDCAFRCTNLRSLNLVRRIRTVGDDVFDGCDQLKQVFVRQLTPTEDIGIKLSSLPESVTVYIPQGTKSLYEQSTGWKGVRNLVESDSAYRIRSLSVEAGSLKSALGDENYRIDSLTVTGKLNKTDLSVLVENVQNGFLTGFDLSGCALDETTNSFSGNFGFSGFRGQRNLFYVQLPNNVEVIQGSAFRGSGLRQISFPSSLKKVMSWAFSRCFSLSGDIRLPEGTRYLADKCFLEAYNIKDIYLPSTLDSISSDIPLNLCSPNPYEEGKAHKFYVNRMTPPKVCPIVDDYYNNPFAYDTEEEQTLRNSKLYVPIGAKENYEKARFWQDFPEIIETAELTGTSASIQGVKTVCDNGLTEVYTLSGHLVSNGMQMPRLQKGLYIVKTGGKTRKVRVNE